MNIRIDMGSNVNPNRTDRDGTMDLVVTACPSADDCQLYIAYNVQVPLCSTSQPSSTPCRDPEALCVADPNFRFNFSLLPDNAVRIPLYIDLDSLLMNASFHRISRLFQYLLSFLIPRSSLPLQHSEAIYLSLRQ